MRGLSSHYTLASTRCHGQVLRIALVVIQTRLRSLSLASLITDQIDSRGLGLSRICQLPSS